MNHASKNFLCLLAVALIGELPVGALAADVPAVPVKDFVRDAEFESAKISPTGEYLAVAMPVGGQTILGILSLKTRKVTGSIRWNRGEHVHDYWWVGPQRVMASMAYRAGPLDQPQLSGVLHGIDADGGNYVHYGRTHESMMMVDGLPHDPQSALVYIIPWLHGRYERVTLLVERINFRDGSRDRVAVVPGYGPPLQVAADRSGRVRFSYSTDEDSSLHIYAKAETPAGWKELKHPHGAPQAITLHSASADGSSVFLTTAESTGRECLREYRFDPAGLTERFCSDSGAVGAPLFSFDEGDLIGRVHESGRSEFEFVDANHPDARLLASLKKTFGDQRVTVTSHTLDAKQLVAFVSSDRNPGDFYLIDRETKKAEYLMSRRPWIDPARMAPMAPISYQTRDGATIHGYLTSPVGREARKAPLVLMPHGGPHGVRDGWDWQPWPQVLASRGYAVLQVNFRGSGGYGYAHERAGHRKWGTLMQDDLTDAVRWAIAQGVADPARICIMGGSYGGYAALMSATREPDLYKCAIGLAGAYDLAIQADDSDTADSRWGRRYLKRVLGDSAQMREQSPITYIERLKVPVLIAHGTADRRVPFSQAKQLRKALQKHGKALEWAEYEDEEHGFRVEANHVDFLGKALAFLDKHIGAAPAAANSAAQTQ